jgi:hypothetical protein
MFKKIKKTIKKIAPKQCYNCGRYSFRGDYLPVKEDVKTTSNFPRAWFCKRCADKIYDL